MRLDSVLDRAGVQLHDSHFADRRRNQRSLSLAHRNDAEADQSGRIRVGNGFLHQSDAARRVGRFLREAQIEEPAKKKK